MKLSLADIKTYTGKSAYERGLQYFTNNKVLSYQITYPQEQVIIILSRVSGSIRNTYTQEIIVNFSNRHNKHNTKVNIVGRCSCPMAYNCKHIAAVCFACAEKELSPSENETSKELVSRELISWLNQLEQRSSTQTHTQENSIPTEELITYCINSKRHSPQNFTIDIYLTRPRKNGQGYIKGKSVSLNYLIENSDPHLLSNENPVLSIDGEIAELLNANADYDYSWHTEAILLSFTGAMALSLMIKTGRCYWKTHDNTTPLSEDEPLTIKPQWKTLKNNSLQLTLGLPAKNLIIPTDPPTYINPSKNKVGKIQSNWTIEQITTLNDAPILPAEKAEALSKLLIQKYPSLPLPTPTQLDIRDHNTNTIQGWLTLTTAQTTNQTTVPTATQNTATQQHILRLEFNYNGIRLPALPAEPQTIIPSQQDSKDYWIRIQRNLELEQQLIQRLNQLGFTLHQAHPQPPNTTKATTPKKQFTYLKPTSNSPQTAITCWNDFLTLHRFELETEGWCIKQDKKFQMQFQDGEWEAEIAEEDDPEQETINDWFDLRFDLKCDGKSYPLAPLLIPLLESESKKLPKTLFLPIDQHNYIRVPSKRLKPFLSILKELFNRIPANKDGTFNLSRFEVGMLDDLEQEGAILRGGEKLRQLAKQLHDFKGIQPIATPPGLNAELRPYQQTGLNWLQFLRQYHFNGILADDMGLGKTIQTLAHLLIEKQAQRLNKPALIIAPTSLMGNWRREAERFTPELKIIILHGNERHQHFDKIETCHLVITTYPLLARDQNILTKQHYHSIVLDEAQVVKNPNTKMAKNIRTFKADHRLCLTGTPLENHLGELWALFDFLMPGFLGNSKTFTQIYRTPIEKNADHEQQQRLVHRIQPFLLRRDKNQVASELPAKTEIIKTIEIDGAQSELYESIRVTMDKRVREIIANKGFARSHITILDALLKLRQVCCDPRLLKLDESTKNVHSAKLQVLMELIPELLEQGRRILLFSQFTSMLALIEDELQQQQLPYSKLTGQTQKRDEVIQQFREGKVDLFLISLKAGGTGLNLTEADTVILYDPWWNPAVETQAIDRTHRIGQEKPVFVYKLVIENSVEEKMLAMQERKRNLASGIYNQSDNPETNLLNPKSLQQLFEPLTPPK